MAEKKRKKKTQEPAAVAADTAAPEPVNEALVNHESADPQPIAWPDLEKLHKMTLNPMLLEYQGKLMDESTSAYIRHKLREFTRKTMQVDRQEHEFTQADLNSALESGFRP